MKKTVSIVIPVFNEEQNLKALYAKLQPVLETILKRYMYEIILVDDGSRDNSWAVMQELAAVDAGIKIISFSRNFGHQMALTAGYDAATGDAIITIDADLQDPPALILDMVQQWEAGFYIVYARRVTRKDGLLKKFVANVYYRILSLIADVQIPRNVGDFRLIDRKVLEVIRSVRAATCYWRGMVAWTGFKHAFVDFKRDERLSGTPGYTWKKSLKLGFDGIADFSFFPLEIAAYAGVFVITTGSLMLAYITYDALVHSTRYPLFKWLVTIVYIFMGVQFVLMWFVGEYIGRIYKQQKQWPLYIIEKTSGFTKINQESNHDIQHKCKDDVSTLSDFRNGLPGNGANRSSSHSPHA